MTELPQRHETKKSLNQLLSDCKVNKYMTIGQTVELEKLREYRQMRDGLVWDCGDNWFQ